MISKTQRKTLVDQNGIYDCFSTWRKKTHIRNGILWFNKMFSFFFPSNTPMRLRLCIKVTFSKKLWKSN